MVRRATNSLMRNTMYIYSSTKPKKRLNPNSCVDKYWLLPNADNALWMVRRSGSIVNTNTFNGDTFTYKVSDFQPSLISGQMCTYLKHLSFGSVFPSITKILILL